jgi:hypothetical protein
VTTKQTLVGFGGTALIAANFWRSSDRTSISSAIFSGSSLSAAHQALLDVAFEAVFVVVATVLAGVNDSIGSAMVVLFVALWILWLMNTGAGSSTKSHAGIAATAPASTG